MDKAINTNPTFEPIFSAIESFLLGKRKKIEYALACLLAKGHLLIEDVPGVGKTTLAKSFAHCLTGKFNRVQFTSDLLPSDLIGVTVFHQANASFHFQPGPIFTNLLLADEINRANPKTQSALLEAMHDGQISHDGKTLPLPEPFFVIATQNHKDQHGTFPLPESQLDRFLMKINLGYPAPSFEKRVFSGNYQQDFSRIPKFPEGDLQKLQAAAAEIFVSDDLLSYIYRLVKASREHPTVKIGVSPRGGQALYRASQSLALIRGRDFVVPDDVRELAHMVLGHRILVRQNRSAARNQDPSHRALFDELLEKTPAPV